MSSIQEFVEIATQAARVAGKVLEDWAGQFTVSEKGRSDLVTEADVAAQQAIYDIIHPQFPAHGFLGEEGLLKSSGESGYRWVIDPLDGTSNYVHRFPYYAVSIGLEFQHEMIVGVVFDPTRDELFAASRGQGATLNGQSLQTTRFSRLDQALVLASFPYGVAPDSVPIRRFLAALGCAQAVHRSGSSALNLAYVAAGRMDGYWSTSLKPWDMAAGSLIVTEAGGRVTQLSGRPLDIEVPDVLASNGTPLHDEMAELLSSVV